MIYTIAVCTVKTPDDGQRNCPKHVEFHSKNKFEKLVHLVGFIIRICHDAQSRELKKKSYFFFYRWFFQEDTSANDVNYSPPASALIKNQCR